MNRSFQRRTAPAAQSGRSAGLSTARHRPGTRTRPRWAGPGRGETFPTRRYIPSPGFPPARSRSAHRLRGSSRPSRASPRSRRDRDRRARAAAALSASEVSSGYPPWAALVPAHARGGNWPTATSCRDFARIAAGGPKARRNNVTAAAIELVRVSGQLSLCRRGLVLWLHLGGVVVHQLLRERPGRELPVRDLRHRRHLGGGAGDEAFTEAAKLLRHDAPLDHLDATASGEVHHGRAGDAGQEAIGDRRVNLAVLDKEDIGAGAFGHAALPVQYHRIGIALALRPMLADGADRVQAGCLGQRRNRLRVRPAIVGQIEPNALQSFRRIEIARPVPARHRQMYGVGLRRHAHHFRTAPRQRADVCVGQVVFFNHQLLCSDDLGDRPRDFEIQDARGILEALGMRGALEDAPAVSALTLEHTARIMQPVRQYMHVGVAPRHQLAIVPDHAINLIERNSHGLSPVWRWSSARAAALLLAPVPAPAAPADISPQDTLLRRTEVQYVCRNAARPALSALS